MLYIYNMSEIPSFEEMLKAWNKRLSEEKIQNLYIIEFISSKNKKKNYEKTDAVVEFEPLYTTFFDISKIKLFKRFIKRVSRISSL